MWCSSPPQKIRNWRQCSPRIVGRRAPVLTVSDLDRFANRGGVIGLVEQDHELHFAINQMAASEARLQVSAQLFHLAVPLMSAISPCGRR
jgi:hypothetical protein